MKPNRKSIEDKINKLLKLSLSSNKHEAELAINKAIHLMIKYSVDEKNLNASEIVSSEFYLEYARIPVWIRELYHGLSYINGCYMVWTDGFRDPTAKDIEQKAKIILTGTESDILNAEYLITFFIREIERMTKEYSKKITPMISKKKRLRSYRIGIAKGLIERVSKAFSNTYCKISNTKNLPLSLNARYEESKKYYLSTQSEVRYVSNKIIKNIDYYIGFNDSSEIKILRPINHSKENCKPSSVYVSNCIKEQK